jgi:hypothetical protein
MFVCDTARMAKEPEPPLPVQPEKPTVWNIAKIVIQHRRNVVINRLVWVGRVEAPDEATAIEKAAAQFKVPANRLMASRRS